jgi:hypothetical protein
MTDKGSRTHPASARSGMSTEHEPVTSIIFGTMTLGYRGYGG